MKESKKSAMLPREEHEKKQGRLGATSNLKYTDGLDNAGKYDSASEGLASYVKKNKAKH